MLTIPGSFATILTIAGLPKNNPVVIKLLWLFNYSVSLFPVVREQWRTHGGVGGQPFPIEDFKRNENLSFWIKPPFFMQTEIAEIALMFFCAIQLAYIILKNFHCDAIIGLPVDKLFWCAALNVDDCKKSETFLF